MTAVKVCGIRSLTEAQWAVNAGAVALGFIFASGSKRYMDPEHVRTITASLPPFVARIGVFVDRHPDHVASVAKRAGLTGIQLHGNEDPLDYVGIGLPIIKALRVDIHAALAVTSDHENDPQGPAQAHKEYIHSNLVSRASDIDTWQGHVQGILIDSVSQGQFGGTGRAVPWQSQAVQDLAVQIQAAGFYLILAGGLTAQNIAAGIATLRPAAVDVNSGVEKDGRKDRILIEEFFRAVQAAQT